MPPQAMASTREVTATVMATCRANREGASEGTGVAGNVSPSTTTASRGHGHREPEDPAPARHLDEPAAHKRAQHIRHGEHGADDAHVGAELARRHHVGERRLG